MPVRSLSSSVLKWPKREEVVQKLEAWAKEVMEQYPEIQRVGYLGSLARGDWGVGSDVDVVVVVNRKDRELHRRLFFSLLRLPVPVDLLLYREEELKSPRLQRFLQGVIWLWKRR